MIKKLRIRIIISAILAFSLVIAVVSILVNVVNYRIVTNQADATLLSIMEFENQKPVGNPSEKPDDNDRPPIPDFMGKTNPEAEYITRFFTVQYDEDGNVIAIASDNIAKAARQEAEELAELAKNETKNSGYINEYRYLMRDNQDGKMVIFLNVMENQQHLKMLRIITYIVAALSLAVVSVLVVIFSGAAIKPIADNIERQKQFITDASHELKTPITSIRTSLDVITIEHGEDEWTDNIKKQSERMTKLVGELVTLSRLDEQALKLTKESFCVSEAAWEMIEVYQSRAKASGRDIKTDIREDVMLDGDKGAIQQMLSVILENAIRYSKGEGDIEFTVSENHNRVEIMISNPTEFNEEVEVDRLFDRFYRPDSSRNTNDGGSGIGLAIAKAVVEVHGGKITANCPNGKKMIIKVVI